MENQNANIQMMEILLDWDPLGFGEGNYETESVDVIQAVHQYDDSKALARKIQAIFEFSTEEIISIKECEQMALKLLFIKNNASCEI